MHLQVLIEGAEGLKRIGRLVRKGMLVMILLLGEEEFGRLRR